MSTPAPFIVLGEALTTGLPEDPALVITGVTNITSETVDLGYMKSQDIEDADGNIASTVLSNYGITVNFTGVLEEGAAIPHRGQAVTLSIGKDANKVSFPTAHLSAVSIAYTSSGQAVVTGTVTGYAKLAKPVASS